MAETELGPLQVLSVHLHPPVSEDGRWIRGCLGTDGLRLAEVQAFTATLEPSLPTLVAGDFNEGTGGAAVRFLEAHGLRTVLPEYAPSAKTWRWPIGPLELRAQIDHITYDTRLEPLAAQVLKTGRSNIFRCGRYLPGLRPCVAPRPHAAARYQSAYDNSRFEGAVGWLGTMCPLVLQIPPQALRIGEESRRCERRTKHESWVRTPRATDGG